MAKRKRNFTDKTIENRLREGRGKGEGKNYLPWITVRDVPSTGRSQETIGWKSNRMHHLLSDLESSYFFMLEWSPCVIDIREQFPLLDSEDSYEETVKIAEEIGVAHPIVPYGGTTNILTTDFLITEMNNGTQVIKARTTKYAKDLNDRRVIEKFEIERIYWERRDVDWKIVTERELNKILVKNVERIHKIKTLIGYNVNIDSLVYIERSLRTELNETDLPLSTLVQKVDEKLGLENGTSLSVVKHLIANRFWVIDMTKKFDTAKKLDVIRVNELPLKEAIVL